MTESLWFDSTLPGAGGDSGGERRGEDDGAKAGRGASQADYLRLRPGRLQWRDEKSDSQHRSPLLRGSDSGCRVRDGVQVLPPGRGVARVRAGTGRNRRP
jgi:hypothetical protein